MAYIDYFVIGGKTYIFIEEKIFVVRGGKTPNLLYLYIRAAL